MEPTPDELAGVVDSFGALTRAELREGLAELAFKRGEEYDPDRFTDTVEDAVRSYHLIAVDPGEAAVAGPSEASAVAGPTDDRADGDSTASDVLLPGPAAFPELPGGARDLRHILDVPDRDPDVEAVTVAAADRFRADAVTAVQEGNHERLRSLLDASYELEAWGNIDLSATRERIDDELAEDR